MRKMPLKITADYNNLVAWLGVMLRSTLDHAATVGTLLTS